MEVAMGKAWAGVDAGKEFHWAHVLDASGKELLSRRVENDETDISKSSLMMPSFWRKRSCGQ
jgi:Transposase